MKKYLILASAALVALAACNKEIEVAEPINNNNGPAVLTFNSVRPQLDEDLKTAWDGSSIVWTANVDKIKVGFTFNSKWWAQEMAYAESNTNPNDHIKFYQSNAVEIDGSDASIGTFSVPTTFKASDDNGDYVFYAVYPSSSAPSNNQDAAPSVNVTLNSHQTPAADSFDGSADIMVGKSKSINSTGLPSDPIDLDWTRIVAHGLFTLKNFQGVVSGETITKVVFTAQNGANLTGEQSVNIADGTVTASNASNTITLEGTNLAFVTEEGNTNLKVWLSVIPATLTSLKVEVVTNKATYVRDITNISKTLKGNTCNKLGINMEDATRTAVEVEYEWVETALSAITSSDIFVIVGNNGSYYAMSNDKGASSAPEAVAVTISGGKLASAPADKIQWTLTKDGSNYTFYPNGTTDSWLYCTNSNNGVRVGTNNAKTFIVSDGYLKHVGTSRFVGIYNGQDWRCYTSNGGNIDNQTFAFYVRTTVTPDTREEAGMSWSEASADASIEDGDVINFSAPTLSNPNSVSPVTYESTDTDVAEVSAAGAVTVKAEGETLIKAIFAGNDSYKPQTVSYTLTVTDNRTSAATTIAEVISGGNGEYTVPNVVVYAVKNNALILGDETGKIYAYKSNHGLTAGDVRTVTGSTTTMTSGVYEFDNPTFTGTGTTTVNHGTAVELDSQASSLQTTLSKPASAVYIHAKGTQSGRNITTTDGNVLYLSAAEEATDGSIVEVYGYIYYYNTSYSNFNFIVTSIEVDTTTPSLSLSPSALNWAAAETQSKTVTVTLNASAAAGDYTLTPVSGDANEWTITNNNGTFSVAPKAANTSTQSAKSITIRVSHTDDTDVYKEVVCTQDKVSSGPTSVSYDFTETNWTVSNGTLSNGTVSFTGEGSANFKMHDDGYFFLGKSGAYLTFPSYDYPVTKIIVTGRSAASGSVKQNIFVGEASVSTETTGATGTNTYTIASAYQTAGTIYTLKVLSNHNTQITKIEVFFN